MAPRRSRKLLSVAALLTALVTSVAAQSGRRSASKPSTTPAPSSSPAESTSTNPTESTATKAPAIQLLVGVDDPSPTSGIPRSFADIVLDACVHRLSQPAGVVVTAGSRNFNRGDATKAAKAETVRYVVWLQIANSSSDAGRQASGSADEYYVNFMLLQPGTAKMKQSGHVLAGSKRVGNVGVGLPPASSGSPLYLEYIIKEEARQVAERILSALGIKDTEWPRGEELGSKLSADRFLTRTSIAN